MVSRCRVKWMTMVLELLAERLARWIGHSLQQKVECAGSTAN